MSAPVMPQNPMMWPPQQRLPEASAQQALNATLATTTNPVLPPQTSFPAYGSQDVFQAASVLPPLQVMAPSLTSGTPAQQTTLSPTQPQQALFPEVLTGQPLPWMQNALPGLSVSSQMVSVQPGFSVQQPNPFSVVVNPAIQIDLPSVQVMQAAVPALGQPEAAQNVAAVSGPQAIAWNNRLKELIENNQAVIFALHIRTFGARDLNGDGKIDPAAGENGTFLSSIPRLDELAALGVNTIHLLPIHPPGQMTKLGVAGSAYAPESYHKLNPEYDVPNNGLSVIDEARIFVNEAHKRGIHIMVDVPSCASVDLAHSRPDLIATDSKGNPLTPTNWIDILMMKNDQKLVDYFQGFFDLMVNQVGVDGFRVDVARARPDEFWKHFIGKYPNMGWLGETYTEEDASPMANIPRDRPEALLRAGFQTMYGQFHIFHQWPNAKTYMDYLLDINEMFERAGGRKSAIGSFLTHDDPSMMGRGGALIYLLSSGLMATQPWTNPYILDGFPTGYKHEFDIFNFVPPHIGDNPEIGAFLKEALAVRKMNPDILTTGSFIPVPVTNDPESQVIAFARHANGRTMLVIANKDVNARSVGTLNIPGLRADQPLNNLVPAYGQPSRFKVEPEKISVELGPGRFHLFEIDTPDIQSRLRSYPGIPQARTV